MIKNGVESRMRRAVITGMGAVSSCGTTLDSLWSHISEGRSGAGPLTLFKPASSRHSVAAEVRDFQPGDFFDKKSIRRYDRAIQYSASSAMLAQQDSGLALAELNPEKVAVVEGTTVGGFQSLFKAHSTFLLEDPNALNPIHVINGYCGEGSSVVAIELKIKGAASTFCSGCCSGNDAIGQALRMIRQDEFDVILAGGSDANVLEALWASYHSLGVMTKQTDGPSAMKPFDRKRDGFVLGDGGAFLVIEELSHALARGARIYAEILGHGRSCEAFHTVDLHPDGIGTTRAIEKALRDAGRHPSEVDYINAHGSSTKSNDPIETKGIKNALQDHAKKVSISGTKPITGHLMGGSGALESVICALSIHRETLPPTINLTEPDTGCDLDYIPNRARRYPNKLSLNLSSGFGGKNSCLVLGQYMS